MALVVFLHRGVLHIPDMTAVLYLCCSKELRNQWNDDTHTYPFSLAVNPTSPVQMPVTTAFPKPNVFICHGSSTILSDLAHSQ